MGSAARGPKIAARKNAGQGGRRERNMCFSNGNRRCRLRFLSTIFPHHNQVRAGSEVSPLPGAWGLRKTKRTKRYDWNTMAKAPPSAQQHLARSDAISSIPRRRSCFSRRAFGRCAGRSYRRRRLGIDIAAISLTARQSHRRRYQNHRALVRNAVVGGNAPWKPGGDGHLAPRPCDGPSRPVDSPGSGSANGRCRLMGSASPATSGR